MNAGTLLALEGAICKWDGICMGHGVDQASYNCALCTLFHDNPNNECCVGCPVYALTGCEFCKNSPYKDWEHAWGIMLQDTPFYLEKQNTPLNELPGRIDKGEVVECAEAELIFLLKLLPEGHKWEDQV